MNEHMDRTILPVDRLKGRSFAFIQLKGGTGKTHLLVNLGAIAAHLYQWVIVLVDLDRNAPLTGAIFADYSQHDNVTVALERISRQEQVDDLLTYVPSLGVYVLKGDLEGVPARHIRWIPHLIQELGECQVQTEQGPRQVDCVLVDAPGENRELNAAILAGVDYVATPIILSSTDVAATSVTIQQINQAQVRRGGWPVFLGLVPNRVARRGPIERAFLEVLLESGKLLPFIPASDTLRGTLVRQSRQGQASVIGFSPHSRLSQRLVRLWETLNARTSLEREYAEEFCQYIGTENLP
jgi:cellulose biosynthesis protein BcsQ